MKLFNRQQRLFQDSIANIENHYFRIMEEDYITYSLMNVLYSTMQQGGMITSGVFYTCKHELKEYNEIG